MISNRVFRLAPLVFLVVPLLVIVQLPSATAGKEVEKSDVKPDRLITMALEYPGVKITRDKDQVSMDVILHNKGKSDENVDIWVAEKPSDWKAKIKTYRYLITGVHVPSGDDKTVTLEAEPADGVAPGKYNFIIKAQTPDSKFQMSQKLTIEILAEESEVDDDGDLKLTTSYPVIRGPSDATFEFSLEVDANLEQDAVYDLFAQGPGAGTLTSSPPTRTNTYPACD